MPTPMPVSDDSEPEVTADPAVGEPPTVEPGDAEASRSPGPVLYDAELDPTLDALPATVVDPTLDPRDPTSDPLDSTLDPVDATLDPVDATLDPVDQLDATLDPPLDTVPPKPGLLGVIALPGLALWRKNPIAGSLLFNAGVTAPLFALLVLLLHRQHIVGLVTQDSNSRGLGLVAIATITSRFIAVWLTADRVRDSDARRHLRLVGSLIVLTLALPAALIVYRMTQVNAAVHDVFQDSPTAGVVSAAPGQDPLAEGFHTVLMMGSDEGKSRLGLRTDTMILAMIHPDSGRAALISVPRNLKHLRFPPESAMGRKFPDGFTDDEGGLTNAIYITVENDPDLQAAYSRDGLEPGVLALMEGLSYSLGITIDDYAMINSCGFVTLVDAIGGVTIHVDKELPMPGKLNCSAYRLTPTIGPGDVFMDGTKALGYVRSRYADSDYQRMERQRTLIQTIASEIGIDDLLLHFTELYASIKENVRTSMTLDEANALVATLQDNDQQFQSVGLTPPLVEPGHPDYAEIKQLMQDIRYALATGQPLDLPTPTT